MTTVRHGFLGARLRRVPLVAVACAAAILGGCATIATPPDRTGGLTVEMLERRGEGTASLYRVERTGEISYGGGFNAMTGKTTWTGQLTDEEIATLRRLIDDSGWLETKPADPGEGDTTYEVRVQRGSSTQRRFKVHAGAQGVEPIRELLDAAARRRLDPVLEALPKPGEQ